MVQWLPDEPKREKNHYYSPLVIRTSVIVIPELFREKYNFRPSNSIHLPEVYCLWRWLCLICLFAFDFYEFFVLKKTQTLSAHLVSCQELCNEMATLPKTMDAKISRRDSEAKLNSRQFVVVENSANGSHLKFAHLNGTPFGDDVIPTERQHTQWQRKVFFFFFRSTFLALFVSFQLRIHERMKNSHFTFSCRRLLFILYILDGGIRVERR